MNQSINNLFIIDSDKSMAKGLEFFLSRRFRSSLNISVFGNAEDALARINANIDIVVLDADLQDEMENKTLKAIKRISPLTEVIVLTSNNDVLTAIESYRRGANEVIAKDGRDLWRNVSSIVYKIVTYPIHLLVREFSVNKFVAIFLLTFFTMAIIVFIVLKVM